MPRQYFRNSYIIDSRWTERGKGKQRAVIHSLFFSFKYDQRLSDYARAKAWEWHEKIVPEWAKTTYAHEFEEVTPDESRGVGFYYLHVLINDTLVEKVHLRRRRFAQTFFVVALGFVQSLVRRFLGG